MKVNELFYSLQGEGYHVGMPAVFVRFSGCNLACPFCDTAHQSGREMTEIEIVEAVKAYPAEWVILTGGEPSLQLTALLVDRLHAAGRKVAIETNGTHALPPGIDWITLSPKDAYLSGVAKARPVLTRADELKVVFTGEAPSDYPAVSVKHYFLQPCDTGDEARNREVLEGAVNWCKAHPKWRLSLQTHKFIGIR